MSKNNENKNSSNSIEHFQAKENEIDNDNLSNDKPILTSIDNGIKVNLNNISGYNTSESSIQNTQQEESEMKMISSKNSKK